MVIVVFVFVTSFSTYTNVRNVKLVMHVFHGGVNTIDSIM